MFKDKVCRLACLLICFLLHHQAHSLAVTRSSIVLDEDKALAVNNVSRTKRDAEDTPSMYAVERHSESIIYSFTSGILSQTRENIFVTNIGKTDIIVESFTEYLISADEVRMQKIKPGQTQLMNFGNSTHRKSYLKFKNPNDVRGYVYLAPQGRRSGANSLHRFSQTKPSFQLDAAEVSRRVILIAAKNVPHIGRVLSGVLKTFWPENKPDVWESIKQQVESAINKTALDSDKTTSLSTIAQFKKRIEVFQSEFDEDPAHSATHYINFAQSMIGLEDEFNTTLSNLPFYTQIINMKLAFLTWGITFAETLQLNEKFVKNLNKYRNDMVSDGIEHIKHLYEAHENATYNTADPDYVFDDMMDVRNFITINGLEYIPYWSNILWNSKIHHKYFVYSEFFGTSSLNLNRLALVDFESSPHTPPTALVAPNSNKKRYVYISRISLRSCWPDTQTICGIRIFYDNGQNYVFGSFSDSDKIYELSLNNRRLTKMTVGGNGAVDYIVFYLSDNTSHPFGKDIGKNNHVFELKNHYIVSIFASNDISALGRQIANIAVTYQLNPVDEFSLIETV